jgi:DNA-binding protein Fis
MSLEKLQQHYQERQLDSTSLPLVMVQLEKLSLRVDPNNGDLSRLSELTPEHLNEHIQIWRKSPDFSKDAFLGVARYLRLMQYNGPFIQMLKYLGSIGVIESILSQLTEQEGQELTQELKNSVSLPEFGLTPDEFPCKTQDFIDTLETLLPKNRLVSVMAGNHHGIPKEAFLEEKALYEAAQSLDDYLADLQVRKITELQYHCDTNTIWYEQTITQAVVDYAKGNQEIMSAVRVGDKLYATKIPYDPDNFLKTKDPHMQAYYACHCPFVRESILKPTANGPISENWCYCSGGFAKYPFEVIFEQPLTVKLLNSALRGDTYCRFEISLEGLPFKR